MLFGIGLPSIDKINKNVKQKSYNKEIITKAAQLCGNDNKSLLEYEKCSIEGKEYYCAKISIGDLIKEDYLDNESKEKDNISYKNPIDKVE